MYRYSTHKVNNVKVLGTVEQVFFQNPNDGFCVFSVNDNHYGHPIKVTATFPNLTPGETVSCVGSWFKHNKYGDQLKASTIYAKAPKDIAAIKKFLSSGIIPGIGECYASKLVAAFGVDTLEVLANAGAEEGATFLTTVQNVLGVSGKGWDTIYQGLLEYSDKRQYEEEKIWLTSVGVGPMAIQKIVDVYGKDTIATIQKNPYILADKVKGFGFLLCDELAIKIGFPLDSPFRIRAGLLHLVKSETLQGSCYILIKTLLYRGAELLKLTTDKCSQLLETLIEDDVLRRLTLNESIVVGLRKFDVYEQEIARKLKLLCADNYKRTEFSGVAAAIEKFEGQTNITLNTQQREVVSLAVNEKCIIITGGPGVGKTLTTKCISMALLNTGEYELVKACAPTGRAAKKLSEVLNVNSDNLNIECSSIHRLLEPKISPDGTFYFSKDAENPIDVNALIVDEMSMVDTSLFYHLLEALPAHAKLILIGDSDQLPSVGAGTVLQDLIGSGVIPVGRLTEVQRQTADSKIILNAHLINKRKMPVIEYRDAEQSDFIFIEENKPEKIRDKIVELVANIIPIHYQQDNGSSYNLLSDIQVLSPIKKSCTGVYELNKVLQEILNADGIKSKNKVCRGEYFLCEKDKVIQTVNNYDMGIFNGDIGYIQSIDMENKLVQVLFAGISTEEKLCYVTYEFEELGQLSLAYATTVHKAQGSEFLIVVMPLSVQHGMLLQKNLLYTGITRGKKLVFIVGQKRAIKRAVQNNKASMRITNLTNRLQEAGDRYTKQSYEP